MILLNKYASPYMHIMQSSDTHLKIYSLIMWRHNLNLKLHPQIFGLIEYIFEKFASQKISFPNKPKIHFRVRTQQIHTYKVHFPNL